MPTTYNDFALASTAALVGTWIRLVSNVTGGGTYISQAATTSSGQFVVQNVPAGPYTLSTGPTSTGPWTVLDTAYFVAPDFRTYNVLDYGAKGDGTSDDATPINNALTAAGTSGGRVIMPACTYSGVTTYAVGSKITVPSNVELVMGGRNSVYIKAISGTFPTSTEVIRLIGTASIGVGCRIMDGLIDCNNISGSIGIYSERINENSGIYRMAIINYGSRAIQIKQPASGGQAQHFTIDDVEIYSGTGTGAAAIGLDIAMTSLGTIFREIRSVTVFATGSTQLTTAIKIDGANGALQSIHVENCVNGILIGSVLGCFGLSVRDVDGMTNVTNLVVLSNAGGSRSIFFADITPGGSTHTLVDNRFSNTINQDIGCYIVGSNTCFASDATVTNQFGRLKLSADLQRSRQFPSETTLVSGVDATAGEIIQVTLTAARLVGAPTNPTAGQFLTFELVQDGTGGRAVTWNAVFKQGWSDTGNTANKRTTITYLYDGTFWMQVGAQSPYL